MLEAEFREWLETRGAKTQAGRNSRVHAVKTIEKNLAALGSPHADLAAAHAADGFTQLRERIKQIRSNVKNGSDEYRILMPDSEKPLNRLSNWNSWLAQYGRFLGGDDSQADEIRDYVLEHYISPARERGDTSVTVVVGPLNNEMGLNMAWPNICQALEGRKFQELADVSAPLAEGPKQSTTRKLTFMLAEGDGPVAQVKPTPTNLILYGPPGTGKTYHTAREAVALCDGIADYPASTEGRTALMARYNELVAEKRIGFVTFHQNYGYEDFVEGLRPVPITNEDGESVGFQLQPEAGVFRQIAERAITEGLAAGSEAFDLADRAIYKMSLGEAADPASDFVFTESIADGYALFGFGDIDWSDPRFGDREEIFSAVKEHYPDEDITPRRGLVQSPDVFRNQLEIGDVLIVAKGNRRFRAIGIVEGDYEYAPRPDGRYCHRRKVRWLWHDKEGLDVSQLYPSKFTMKTIYQLKDSEVSRPLIAQLVANSDGREKTAEPLPHVLIIDEINRANVSKVFGELITLLEADKRAGMDNALSVTLPYSKRSFSVPANLHIIGTMNTADRSIALLDTALRRRFNFREMAPDPSLLDVVEGIDLKAVLTTINRRIEYLIDREHRIGHAFFINCETKEQVEGAMRDKVIPLLQEYFFEDWSRVAAVLGNGFIREEKLDPPPGIDGDSLSSWSVLSPFRDDAFERLIGKAAIPAEE